MLTRRRFLTATAGGALAAASSALLPPSLNVAAQPGPNGDPRVFILNAQTLSVIRDKISANDPSVMRAFKSRVDYANTFMGKPPVSVTQKTQIPPSGDIHDYYSLARYYWPDPSKPDGLPYIFRDGQVNPDTTPDADNFVFVINAANALSQAYTFTADERYATQAATFLRTWFLSPDTRMNPNLNYSQAIKGKADGTPGGIIDTAILWRLVDNIGLIEPSPGWSDDDKAGIRDWMGHYLDWLLTSPLGQANRGNPNNQATWTDVQVVALARFTGRDDVAQQVLQESIAKRIAVQIEPDGRQPQELARTNSLNYSVYNLFALCNLATLGAGMNIDLWHAQTDDGRSIRKALDFVLPYALGQQAWPYQQITPFDASNFPLTYLMASVGYGDSGYYDAAKQVEGSNATSSVTNLLFLRP